MTETLLDKALIAVDDAEDATEEVKHQAEDLYYELFLNTVLYIPTWDVPDKDKTEVLEEDVAIQPVIIEDESGEENKTYIMLFDSEERLNEWADGQKVGMAGLSGYDIINILGSENHMLLNPSSECSKEFCPDEIEWLKASVVDSIEA